jgi:hypothetical protein
MSQSMRDILMTLVIVVLLILTSRYVHHRFAHNPDQKVRWTKTMVARTAQAAAQLGIREDGVVVWRAMQFMVSPTNAP